MIGRNRRYGKGRRADLKTRLGIATAVIVGGGAIGVAAVATSAHAPESSAKAGYSTSSSSYGWNGGNTLSSALSSWSWNQTRSLTLLQSLTLRAERQQWHNRTMFAAERGILVLLTPKFAIVKSNTGALNLWWLSGATAIKDATTSTTAATALTGNATLAQQILASTMLAPTTFMAGTTTSAMQLLAPATTATTTVVRVANTNLTVTVTVTNTTATVRTTNSFLTAPTLFTQSAFFTTHTLTRGDLVLFAGTRTANVLRAQLILFAPLTTSDLTGTSTSSGVSTSSNGSSGVHY
jgi:hypothetical protein